MPRQTKILTKERNENFTTIYLQPIQSYSNLSWKAKGLWTYLISRPEDWQFYLSDILKRSQDGRTAVKSALKELKNANLLSIKQTKDENNGQFKSIWIITEDPKLLDEADPRKPVVGNPTSGNPTSGNPTSENKQGSKKYIINSSNKEEDSNKQNIVKSKYNDSAPTNNSGLNYKVIKKKWNQRVPEDLHIRVMTQKRKDKLQTRYKEENFNLDQIIDALQDQPFCLGDNEREWIADFSWLVENSENYVKVLEHRYGDKPESDRERLDRITNKIDGNKA